MAVAADTGDIMATQKYHQQSRHLLTQALRELDQGDLVQASEKGWGAAAQMVKAIAEQRGWRHRAHDPAATLLLPGRTHHPQGPSPHPAPSQGLALGEPVQSRPGAIASPAAPFLTPPSASDPSTRPSNRLAVPRQAELRGSPAAICPTISPSAATREPSASPWHSCLYPHPLESGGVRALLSHHPRFSSLA